MSCTCDNRINTIQTVYTPVLEDDSGCFYINGSSCVSISGCETRIRRHCTIRDGSAKVIRYDEERIMIDNNNSWLLD